MKRAFLIAGWIVAAGWVFSAPALATLTILDGGTLSVLDDLVHDDDSGLTWVRSLSVFSSMSYADQTSAIGSLIVTHGSTVYSDWRMAGREEMASLWEYQYNAYLASNGADWNGAVLDYENCFFHPSEAGGSFGWSWYGRINEISASDEYQYCGWRWDDNAESHSWCGFYGPSVGSYYTSELAYADGEARSYLSAWVVTGGPTAPIPEPTTSLLLGIALFGSATWAWRRRRS